MRGRVGDALEMRGRVGDALEMRGRVGDALEMRGRVGDAWRCVDALETFAGVLLSPLFRPTLAKAASML